jgi:hypothetical protein
LSERHLDNFVVLDRKIEAIEKVSTGRTGRAVLESALAATQSNKEAKPVEIPLVGQ